MAKKRLAKKRLTKKKSIKRIPRWHAAPLKGSFLVTSILGFFLSYYYVYPVSNKFGFACMLIFVIMFIASLVSMTKAPKHIDGK